MFKLFGYLSVLSLCVWGQSVSPTMNPLPTRQFGQPSLAIPLTQATPNLAEGREFNTPGGIALDTSVSPPILYVADTGNNRVLAFKNSSAVAPGKYADLVIGQNDFVSTLAQGGASSSLTTGLNSPVGLAVDNQGNLWVADAGNNRILRFPTPFNNPGGSVPTPDIVIGQKSYSGTSVNEGQGNICSAKSLATSSGGVYVTGLAIDSSGNLWATDPLNNRVLMYPASSLVKGAAEVAATVVLGQTSFSNNSLPGSYNQLSAGVVAEPAGLTFDSSGNMYVIDSLSRVLFFQGPAITTAQAATRILGIAQQTGSTIVYPNQYTLGFPNTNGNLVSPNGVFTSGNHLYVADTPANRIVEYDVPANWPAATSTLPSPPILNVIGQIGYTTGTANQGLAQPNASTLYGPYTGVFDANGNLWVADSGNNRVLAFKVAVTGGYVSASQMVGQLDYIYNAPNLIEGKELYLVGAPVGSASAMVVDTSSNPPHLYIADPGNNRVLCFKNAYTVGGGTSLTYADLVIGQPDLFTSEINYPGGQAGSPTATGLYSPVGVAVDNNGNLYVADAGNGRVLRFPAPFSQPAGHQPTANLVLGQPDFVTVIQNASASLMHTPFGLAFFAGSDANATPLAGGLAVSDPIFNRILVFKKGAGGDFTSGQSAYLVLGQTSFTGVSAGNGLAALYKPLGIASDTSDRLYVADYGNNRVMAFTQVPESLSNGPTSTLQYTGLNAPQGVAINRTTTELWVANTNSNQLLRYPQFTTCELSLTGGCQPTSSISTNAAPLGIATDGAGNVIIGDVANRATFYFPELFYRSAASYASQQPLVPGMLAIIGRLGLPMTIGDGAATTNPWPTTLGGVTLTVNSANGTQSAPLFLTNSGYGAVYFQVPYEVPTAGTANFTITQNSTGAIIGVGTFQLGKTNPGFFTSGEQGVGPLAATNKDGTANSATNPAARGDYITLWLTGLGQSPNQPTDGYAPVTANFVSTSSLPEVVIQAANATVLYSGPGAFAGGWQINVTIPQTAVPGAANTVALIYLDAKSTYFGTTASDNISPGADGTMTTAAGNFTTIFVK